MDLGTAKWESPTHAVKHGVKVNACRIGNTHCVSIGIMIFLTYRTLRLGLLQGMDRYAFCRRHLIIRILLCSFTAVEMVPYAQPQLNVVDDNQSELSEGGHENPQQQPGRPKSNNKYAQLTAKHPNSSFVNI